MANLKELQPIADRVVEQGFRPADLLFPGEVPRSMEHRNAIIDELPEDVGTDEQFNELGRRYFDQGGATTFLMF
jgi:hypothetical protein